ncbi:MAG: RDD family protein [Candidatus Zixiibacteriota bacterium]
MKPTTQDLAGYGERLGGAIIDGIISMIVIFPLLFGTGIFQNIVKQGEITFEQQVFMFGLGWSTFLILNGYLLYKRGQTIGKAIVKTRIVDLEGRIPGFAKLFFLRYVVIGLLASIPMLGTLVSLADVLFIFGKHRRCLHDHLAGTVVVDAAYSLNRVQEYGQRI